MLRSGLFLLTALLCLELASASATPLYEVYGPRGSVTFTSRKPPSGVSFKVLRPRARGRSPVFYRKSYFRPKKSAFDELIRDEAGRAGLDWNLVKAVIHAESSFDPNAVSPKGAMGLMQLMPATAKRFGVSNAFVPSQNIRGGVEYLSWLHRRYRGDLSKTLAAYNAGERAVDRAGGIPPYKETRTYVSRVKNLLASYRRNQPS